MLIKATDLRSGAKQPGLFKTTMRQNDWVLTYPTYLKSILKTKKKIVRIITIFEHKAPSEPLFKSLSILNFLDIIKLQILSFIFQ